MKHEQVYDDQKANELFDKHWNQIYIARSAELKDYKTITHETFQNAYHY